MFEKDEVLKELHARLVAAGINPLDPKVQAISDVVNAFYAEKTREVLEQMQAVLSKTGNRRRSEKVDTGFPKRSCSREDPRP